MYCKYCGEHNSNDESYCSKCGSLIKINTISPAELNITENKAAFCKKCGSEVLDRYCTECGTIGYVLEISQKSRAKVTKPIINPSTLKIEDIKSKIEESALGDIKSVDDVKEILDSKPIIKTSFISSLKILGIGLLISFLIFTVISRIDAVKQIFYAIDMAASYSDPSISKLKPNFIDFFNLTLLSPINIGTKLQGEIWGGSISANSKIVLSFKLLILLLIPAIGVLISQFKNFKDDSQTQDNLLEYGLISIFFSILVKIVGIIGATSIKIKDPSGINSISLKVSIHNVWSLLTVFLITFAIHILISMIFKKDNPFKKLNIGQCPELGDRVKVYLKSMGVYIGIVSVALTLTLIILISKSGLKTKAVPIIGILLLPSTFFHTWLFSFGNSITTTATGQSPISLNMTNLWKSIGSIKRGMPSNSHGWEYWGYLLLIAIFLGLIYVIFKTIKDMEKEEYFKKLAFLAGIISLVNMGISYFVSTGVKATANATGGEGISGISRLFYDLGLGFLGDMASVGELKQVYPLFTIILLSFIWVFAIGAVVYFVREQEIYQRIVRVIEYHSMKFVIGYSILILLSSYLLQTKLVSQLTYEIMNIFPFLDILL